MAQYGCAGSLQVCAMRGVRLNADCSPATGANAGFVTTALISLATSAEVEEGEEFQVKDGCGRVSHYVKDKDRIKRQNVTATLASYDFELVEILTGNKLLLDSDGKTIGIRQAGPASTPPDGAYLEVWTKAVEGDDTCSVPDPSSPIPGWFRWIFPRVFLTMRDFTLENGFANMTLEGFGTPNSQLPDDGPFADWPWDSGSGSAEWDAETPEVIVLDSAGPPAGSCGYITVGS